MISELDFIILEILTRGSLGYIRNHSCIMRGLFAQFFSDRVKKRHAPCKQELQP
jgi:hypothetical protein